MFAVHRVMLILLRTVCNVASPSLCDVASKKPLVFGNLVFEKFDIKMGMPSIVYRLSSIVQRLSSSPSSGSSHMRLI